MTAKQIKPAMQRLYEAFVSLNLIDPAQRQAGLARLLNTDSQKIYAWETRGPSKEGRIDIQERFGINATWVATGSGPMTIGDPALGGVTVMGPVANGVPRCDAARYVADAISATLKASGFNALCLGDKQRMRAAMMAGEPEETYSAGRIREAVADLWAKNRKSISHIEDAGKFAEAILKQIQVWTPPEKLPPKM